MNEMISVFAWIVMVVMVLEVVGMPLMIGQTREPYSTSSFYGALIGAVLVIPVCLRALGYL